MQVGMIGAGRMGTAMARNLIKAGHKLRIFDIAKDNLRELEKDGAEIAASTKDAFGGDVTISMLPNDEAMRAVFVTGDTLPASGAKTIHVNMATASVACADELTALHKQRGVPYIAATVWGRPDAAAAAKLSIVTAGDAAAIDKAQPLFDVLGQRTTRLGDKPSNANVAKIAGNLMVAAAIEAMGEAAALVRGYGLSSGDFLNTVNTALFDVPVYRGYGNLIATGAYEPPGFDLVLGLKDVRLALAAGEKANVPLPFASVLRDAFLDSIANGDGKKDWAAIARGAARRAGLES
ncbi:MAG: NAD(P)-dependent oxidoreductase [Xanthobacteraceae bacterium]|uniref:NAD(P)-dependent oxidoreductase n=1 Tax=Pseudolabrys sp. TaxID=1960880 RepID=UPI003D1196E8